MLARERILQSTYHGLEEGHTLEEHWRTSGCKRSGRNERGGRRTDERVSRATYPKFISRAHLLHGLVPSSLNNPNLARRYSRRSRALTRQKRWTLDFRMPFLLMLRAGLHKPPSRRSYRSSSNRRDTLPGSSILADNGRSRIDRG